MDDDEQTQIEDEAVRVRAHAALGHFTLTGRARQEAWDAFQKNPVGVERIAKEALTGNDPTALFVYLLREGAWSRSAPTDRPSNRDLPWRVEALIEDDEGERVLIEDFASRNEADFRLQALASEGKYDAIDLLWWNPQLRNMSNMGNWEVRDGHRRVVIRPDAPESQFHGPTYTGVIKALDDVAEGP